MLKTAKRYRAEVVFIFPEGRKFALKNQSTHILGGHLCNQSVDAMKKSSLLPVLFLFPQQYALSFSIHSLKTKSSSSLGMALSDLGDLVSLLPHTSKSTELWLDLRGTEVHPRTAVDYLMKELEQEGLLFLQEDPLIEKVLLSDSSFQKLLNVSDPFVEAAEILYPPENGDGFLASSRSGLSLPFGNIMPIPRDNSVAVGDPMMAMRILGDGKWIVLENEERELDPDKESLRMDAISSFLDIASTASTGQWEVSAPRNENVSGLIVQSKKAVGDTTERGGVAVHCPTKSFLVQLALVLQCLKSVSTATMTESGIIIQGGSAVYVPSLPTAVLLPFDLLLWKTAMLVFGQDNFRASNE